MGMGGEEEIPAESLFWAEQECPLNLYQFALNCLTLLLNNVHRDFKRLSFMVNHSIAKSLIIELGDSLHNFPLIISLHFP